MGVFQGKAPRYAVCRIAAGGPMISLAPGMTFRLADHASDWGCYQGFLDGGEVLEGFDAVPWVDPATVIAFDPSRVRAVPPAEPPKPAELTEAEVRATFGLGDDSVWRAAQMLNFPKPKRMRETRFHDGTVETQTLWSLSDCERWHEALKGAGHVA